MGNGLILFIWVHITPKILAKVKKKNLIVDFETVMKIKKREIKLSSFHWCVQKRQGYLAVKSDFKKVIIKLWFYSCKVIFWLHFSFIFWKKWSSVKMAKFGKAGFFFNWKISSSSFQRYICASVSQCISKVKGHQSWKVFIY